MKTATVIRALPTLFRIGFAEAVAYRAEMLVWILATTMPLVMLALWTAVAREAPIGPFGEEDFIAYFLATFIVRQLTGSWAAWQINFEIKSGVLAARLLRPLPVVISYAVDNLSAVPMRVLVSVPVALIGLASVGRNMLPSSALAWSYLVLAVAGGWLITFLVNVGIGTLALYMESSNKLMDVWFAAFMVFSGYMIPIELFPDAWRKVADYLPFRYQIGLPVEIFTNRYSEEYALSLLVRQWTYVGLVALVVTLLWRRGLRRFAAFGG
jgi:ABC-2 type transport system permease protein